MSNRELIIDILHGRICPYCGKEPIFVNSVEIYGEGHDYGNMYWCKPCDAFVGTHHGKIKPLGRLANKELREWKKKAHASFDPLWKMGKINEVWPKYIPNTSNRKKAYKWLAKQLGVSEEFCHIGMFSVRYCKRTIEICKKTQ